MREEIAIGDITIGDRIRKDMGSIRTLADSMERLGQLKPIGLDTNDNLIFGHRRILAAMSLDWEKIWFERFDNLDTALLKLQAERDENTEHKAFTPSESAEMGMRLESLEKPKAQERKAATLKQNADEDRASKLDERSDKGRTDEKVAAAVGMSKDTYRKAKAVVEAAKNPDAPPEVKAAAEEMDRTGKVDPAYKKIKAEPKPYDVTDDVLRLTALRDKLAPNWERKEDIAVIRQLFNRFAKEV